MSVYLCVVHLTNPFSINFVRSFMCVRAVYVKRRERFHSILFVSRVNKNKNNVIT